MRVPCSTERLVRSVSEILSTTSWQSSTFIFVVGHNFFGKGLLLIFYQFEVLREELVSNNLIILVHLLLNFPFMKIANDPSAKTFASVIRYSLPELARKVPSAPKTVSSRWKFANRMMSLSKVGVCTLE